MLIQFKALINKQTTKYQIAAWLRHFKKKNILFENLTVPHLVRKISNFYTNKNSLPNSQQPFQDRVLCGIVNALNSYSLCLRFEFRSWQVLHCRKYFFIFYKPSTKKKGWFVYYAMALSFKVLPKILNYPGMSCRASAKYRVAFFFRVKHFPWNVES